MLPHTKKSHSLTSLRRQGLTQSSYILCISKWLHLWIHVHFQQKLTEHWAECMSDQWEVFHHICRITDSLENIITWQRIPPCWVLHKTLIPEFSYASCNTQFHRWKDCSLEELSASHTVSKWFVSFCQFYEGHTDSFITVISIMAMNIKEICLHWHLTSNGSFILNDLNYFAGHQVSAEI